MFILTVPLTFLLGPALPAQVHAYECTVFPVDAGWEEINRHCDPEDWLDEGWLWHHVGGGCPEGPNRGQFDYRRSLDDFIGVDEFFVEWRMQTDGERSEIPGSAPAVISIANVFGVVYKFTIAKDLIQLIGFRRPLEYREIAQGKPHTFRIDIFGTERFVWYIDGQIVHEGIPEGPFPTERSDFNWRSKAWYLESTTRWEFIRFGRIPQDASGDYDSDDDRDLFDHYFVHECFSQSGPDADAGPGCRFADFDGDSDTDLRDFAEFQNRFTGGE